MNHLKKISATFFSAVLVVSVFASCASNNVNARSSGFGELDEAVAV